jgi:hypothetical protein
MIITDACTKNIINGASGNVNDASRSIVKDFRVMLQIVASLTNNSRGIIYDLNMCH